VILSAKYVWPNMTGDTLYAKSRPTQSLDMKKNASKTRMTFSTHKQTFPSKTSPFLGYSV